jgi:hypothetical protein
MDEPPFPVKRRAWTVCVSARWMSENPLYWDQLDQKRAPSTPPLLFVEAETGFYLRLHSYYDKVMSIK